MEIGVTEKQMYEFYRKQAYLGVASFLQEMKWYLLDIFSGIVEDWFANEQNTAEELYDHLKKLQYSFNDFKLQVYIAGENPTPLSLKEYIWNYQMFRGKIEHDYFKEILLDQLKLLLTETIEKYQKQVSS
jgi:hypothetical protein